MRRSDGLDEVAAVVHRLSVLLAAGVAPASALGHLASAGQAGAAGAARRRRLLRAVALEAARGGDVTEALLRGVPASRRSGERRRSRRDDGEEAAWAALAASWRVAADSGAPVAAALAELAESMRESGRARRDIDVALAGPAATGRVVGVLPLVGLGFGSVLGFDVVGVLLGTAPGLVCLGAGAGLMVLAQLWTRRLVRGADPGGAAPGLALDLLAVALAGGGAIDRARAQVLAALAECGLASDARALEGADAILALSSGAGVPAGRLLRSEATLVRLRTAGLARERAARLGVMLMLPLGVCVLPAFLLLGVAPMIVSVLLSTFAATS